MPSCLLFSLSAAQRLTACSALALASLSAQAQSGASVPYSPSWPARHAIHLLVDEAGLALTTSHWPLPAAAVAQALDALPATLPSHLQSARDAVRHDVGSHTGASASLQLRNERDSLGGFDQNYTPGSSLSVQSAAAQAGDGVVAWRLGARVEASPNSLQSNFSGWGTEGRTQLRLHNSSAVLQAGPVHIKAFSHPHWWGVGWQSSLVNGHNNPAWTGLGLQRAAVRPSASPWLSWMGPWSFDAFVAQAQDPVVAPNQAKGYLFTGMRLTLAPQPWLEIGLSRGIQFGGTGRPNDGKSYLKALLGQEVNQNPGDPPDTSAQVAGYDIRLRCPASWGCAAYGQFMGEDEAGYLPTSFMSLLGVETTWGQGRYRAFAEYANTNGNSLKFSSRLEPGMVNTYYPQGYTHGARWVGSAQGGGSRVWTLGLMDGQAQRLIKLHHGTVPAGFSVGAYQPSLGAAAPHGTLTGLSVSQRFAWHGLHITPELDWLSLSAGHDQRANRTRSWRVGLTLSKPLP